MSDNSNPAEAHDRRCARRDGVVDRSRLESDRRRLADVDRIVAARLLGHRDRRGDRIDRNADVLWDKTRMGRHGADQNQAPRPGLRDATAERIPASGRRTGDRQRETRRHRSGPTPLREARISRRATRGTLVARGTRRRDYSVDARTGGIRTWQSADQHAFGVERTALLEKLARRNAPITTTNSYLLTRSGREISYLGPSVCDSTLTAQKLMQRALQNPSPGGWFWDLMVDNKPAVSLAQDLGFAPKRHLLRMVRGKDVRGNEGAVYALAGFELG